MLRTLLVLLLLSGGFVAALFSRWAALLFYLWFAFFRPQEWVWVDITSLHLSLVLAVLLIVPALGTGIFPTIRHPLAFGMVALLASSLVAELVTPMPRSDWDWLYQVAASGLVDLMLISIVNSADRLRTVVAVVCGSIGFHAAKQGALFLVIPGHRIAEGVGGAFGDNNSYAVVCAMVGFILLSMGRPARNQWERLGFTGAGCLCLLAVIATYSRGGFLALSAGLLVYGVLRRVRLRWFVGALVAGSLMWTFMEPPAGYTDRLKTIGSYQDDESAAGRLYFWGVALVMSWDQPLGVGIQNFNNVYDKYDPSEGRAFGKSRSVHSSHFQVLTEAGMFGFATWVFMLLYSLLVGLRVRRRGKKPGVPNGALYSSLADGLTAAMVAFIVGGAFTAIAWSDFVWCLLAVMTVLDRLSLADAACVAEAQTGFARTASFSPGLSEWTNSYAGS